MNYDKLLQEHGISDGDIDRIVQAFAARAAEANAGGDAQAPHPQAVYHTAAVDMAMGAVDLHKEVKAGMNSSHSARSWLSILTGVALEAAG